MGKTSALTEILWTFGSTKFRGCRRLADIDRRPADSATIARHNRKHQCKANLTRRRRLAAKHKCRLNCSFNCYENLQ